MRPEPTILVVDDSKFAVFRLTRLLQEAGHEVIGSVRHSEEALGCYKKLQPELVTLESGIQLACHINGR